MATEQPVQLGIIGTGLAVEKLHWPALKGMPERFAITAFCDIRRDAAEHFAGYTGASMENWTADAATLLARDDVEAVLISLPIPESAEMIRHALEAGKHVLCEKPPGRDLSQIETLFPLATEYRDKVLLIAENYFYRDDVRWAKAKIAEGAIGEPYLMTFRTSSQLVPRDDSFSSTPWRWAADYAGGPHLDGGVHHTAQIRMLMGDARRVHGEIQDANTTHGGPSVLTVNIGFVSDAIGSYTANYPELAIPPEPQEMRLYGTEAVMIVKDKEIAIGTRDKVTTWQFPDADGGYAGEFTNFHEAITRNAPVVGTLGQSFRTAEIVLLGIASAEQGMVLETAEGFEPLSATPLPLWLPEGADALDVNAKVISE